MHGTPRPRRGPRIAAGLALTSVAVLALSALPAQAVPQRPSGPVTWAVDLAGPVGTSAYGVVSDGTGLTLAGDAPVRSVHGPSRGEALRKGQPRGAYTLPPHRLDRAVDRVSATIEAAAPDGGEVAVQVRGHAPDGRWTEWREVRGAAPARLPEPSDQVQVRLELAGGSSGSGATASPRVSKVALTALPAPADASAGSGDEKAAPLTFRLFATREGLVGGTTANGHIIQERDHFVALPSRRALNPNDSTRDFQVQVCYPATGRCETAPVWDVGPWNTKDDYWNPSAEREMWQDLPQGLPESQAAFESGYNGGLDQFGRQVLNPAGIDLADGTFWDGLGMNDNDWVEVTFLWTG
jgi:hypothetical protein